jgi:hypothetical protein
MNILTLRHPQGHVGTIAPREHAVAGEIERSPGVHHGCAWPQRGRQHTARSAQGSGVLERIVDGEAFRPRRHQ